MARSAEKELSSLPKPLVSVLWQRIRSLAEQPRPAQSKRLKGAERAHRLRVRDYRIIYNIDDDQKLVIVKAVRHRRDAYR
ncbi:MAG: type II toxin-antitoxin system RelE/ParE family toxin [Chloroflexi bacterium]|nr:type II toxin-antitoxin system RelE/ParE family toxin [Chloroflexota bacterium]